MVVVLLVALVAAPSARAEFASLYGGDLSCAVQPGSGDVRQCSGTTTTWDGQTKIDVNVTLPPQPASGPDGPYPLIGEFHGWGGEKLALAATEGFAKNGYAVFTMSDRGWGQSCGAADLEKLLPACAKGYNHLMDDRYEVRDAQYLIGELADEGVAEPQRIGATGESYGGGISMALAALRDRVMMPDGSLVPWVSPGGRPMAIAAAVPQWPWSDLAYALAPNGTTLDYVADSPYKGPNGNAPIGIEKASFVTSLLGLGAALSNFSLTDPEAAVPTWYARLNVGEPYDGDPTAESIFDQVTTYHSSYYVNHAEPPAPLLIQSGWNDDLFPPDEAIRYYNRTRTQFPGNPISLFFMDDGHMRSQNKEADVAVFRAREQAWFDYYLKGVGTAPGASAEALTTTCPSSAASEGPYRADDWRDLSPGEIRTQSAAAQTIVPGSGDPTVGTAFDPIASIATAACTSASGADEPGVATYRLPATPSPGFTLLGSPTIIADLATTGTGSELAARLVDVSPAGTETLVARGLLRPGAGGHTVFQLHPQAYRFAPGDVPKLELLPSDAPYARPSNTQTPITVSNLELRLPVHDQPGSLGGIVEAPLPPVLPPGYELASDYRTGAGIGASTGTGAGTTRVSTVGAGRIRLARGRIVATRRRLLLRLACAGPGPCSGHVAVSVKARGGSKRSTLGRANYALASGGTRRFRLALTKAGRRFVAARHARAPRAAFPARLSFEDAGHPTRFQLTRRLHLRMHG
jgi:predicted acyl esterase